MSRGVACLISALGFLAALAMMAVTATACEGGGGGGPELTTLATKLSGESKESEELTVLEGAKVKDKATLSGKNASKATGKVTYKVYSDKECKTLVTAAGEVTVSGESVPASSEEELEGGKTYYWQAHYGGDTKNAESTSPCTEVLNVKAKTSLSTELSGAGSEGEEITILEGSKTEDKATLSGTNSSTAGGKALYKVYSDKECKTLVTEAGEVTVTSGSIPASNEEELKGVGTYYWQTTYKGDGLHQESKSSCGGAVQNVVACTFPYCERTITPGVKLNLPLGTCTASPIMLQGTEKFLLTAGHCFGNGEGTPKEKVQSAYPTNPTANKLIGENITFNNTEKYDIAEVKIENGEWLLAGEAPPVLVQWEIAPKVSAVVGQTASVAGDETCMSGAVSGLQCGEVLKVGATVEGVKNLVLASVKVAQGDSGAPEFRLTKGGVLIQGTLVKGSGSFAFSGLGTLTNGSGQIKKFPEGNNACKKITEMKTMWEAAVPISGTGVPAKTTVTACNEELSGLAAIDMSAAATESGVKLVKIGQGALAAYEPMSQIEAMFPGQTLLEH